MLTTAANAITAREADLINKSMLSARNAALGTAVQNLQSDAIANGVTVDALDGTFAEVAGNGYQGSRTIAQLNALSPSSGDIYVAADDGTPSAGSSDALVEGDVAEYNGSAWIKILSATADSVPPAGTVLLVGNGTLVSPLTEGTDEGKIATFNGSTLTPSLVTPTAGTKKKVAVSADTNSIKTGQVFEYNTVWNSITAKSNAAAADRVTNTATGVETFFTSTRALQIANVAVGDVVEWDVFFNVVQTNASDTLNLKVYLGTVSLGSTGALDVADADFMHFRGYFQVTTIGASGVITGVTDALGLWGGSPLGIALVVGPSQAVDLSANLNLRASATWSAASTSNKVDLIGIRLKLIKSGTV